MRDAATLVEVDPLPDCFFDRLDRDAHARDVDARVELDFQKDGASPLLQPSVSEGAARSSKSWPAGSAAR